MQPPALKLYLVARWGNNEDGPNGSDTLFLVRAPNYHSAAEVVDCAMAAMKETRATPVSNWVCEIGDDGSGQTTPAILKGPFFGLSGADGYSSVWTRESMEDKWVSRQPDIEAASN